MTVVNIATGEAIETLTRDDAERLSNRISARLDVIADNYTAVMPMIREAITRQAHAALGYRSPGDYARERFGDALAKLDPTMRREVVRELTEAGMSVRAIAPVVGISKSQVANDQREVSTTGHLSSLPTFAEHMAKHQTSRETSATPADEEAVAATTETTEGADAGRTANYDPRPPVVGIDGKTYSRPAPKPAPPVRGMTDAEQAIEYVETVARNLTVLSQLTVPERRAALREAFPIALGKVSPAQTDRFTPIQMRAVADGLHDLADEWENSNV